MTTQVIDTTSKGNAFPTGYVGAGTLLGHAKTQGSSVNRTDGYFTSTGDPVEIRIGFDARKIVIFNETDAIKWEKMRGMAAANSIKTTLGGSPAQVLDTTTAINNGTTRVVTLSAGLCGTAKNIIFHIED